MNISITPELEEFVKAEVKTGWTGIESAASAAPKPTDGQLPGFET